VCVSLAEEALFDEVGSVRGSPGSGVAGGNAAGDLELVASVGHYAYRNASNNAFWVVSIPPWVMAHTERSSTSPCGANWQTVALAGALNHGGTPAAKVTTTWIGSSAS
jgi:hypothetical protein